MSTEGLFVLLPVLLFSLILAAGVTGFLVGRGRKRKPATGAGTGTGNAVQGTITAARILDNDSGSVTQFYPAVDVSYTVGGRGWTAANLPVARETHADRARVSALLENRLRPGQPVSLEFDPADPGRVRIASL